MGLSPCVSIVMLTCHSGRFFLSQIISFATRTCLYSFIPTQYNTTHHNEGTICLSILNEEEGWRPAITLKQVLIGIQDLLNEPNPSSPAQSEAYNLFIHNKAEYKRRVKAEAKKNTPS